MANNPSNYESSLWKEPSVSGNYKNRDGEVICDDFFWDAVWKQRWIVAENMGALNMIDSILCEKGITTIPREFNSFFNPPSSPGMKDIVLKYKKQTFHATLSLPSRLAFPMLKFSAEFVPIIAKKKEKIESTTHPEDRENIPVLVFEPTETDNEYVLHFCRLPYKPEELSQTFSNDVKIIREKAKFFDNHIVELIEYADRYFENLIKDINTTLELYKPYNSKPAISLGSDIEIMSGKTNLPHTPSKVYYLLPYVPTYQKTWNGREEFLDIATSILKYKDQINPEYYEHTKTLFLGILELSRIIPQKRIALVGIPRSTVGQKSAICTSIPSIILLTKVKGISVLRNYDKELIDYSNALCRVKSIPVGHRGGYSTDDEKRESLEYWGDEITDDETAYIILDDITTQGNSMMVAKHILIEQGANPDSIYMLSLSKTVSKYEKL